MSDKSIPDVNYSRKFDLRGISQQIADVLQVQALQIDSRVTKEIARPIIVKMLKEGGASDDSIATALKALDESEMEKPIAQPFLATSFNSDAQAEARAKDGN